MTKQRYDFHMTEPITFPIDCQQGLDRTQAVKHDITVNPDWSVDTPHDMETERAAAAFGSRLSCLGMPKAIEAVRLLVELHERRAWHPLHYEAARWWVDGAGEFSGPFLAAAHVRSPHFAAMRTGATVWQTRRLFEVVWGLRGVPATSAGVLRQRHPDVVERQGIGMLWDAGIHPRRISPLRQWAGIEDGPIAVDDYIAIAYTPLKPRELRRLTELSGGVSAMLQRLQKSRSYELRRALGSFR